MNSENCGGFCASSCESNCFGDCKMICTTACQNSCSVTCDITCTTTCIGSCYTLCLGECKSSCTSSAGGATHHHIETNAFFEKASARKVFSLIDPTTNNGLYVYPVSNGIIKIFKVIGGKTTKKLYETTFDRKKDISVGEITKINDNVVYPQKYLDHNITLCEGMLYQASNIKDTIIVKALEALIKENYFATNGSKIVDTEYLDNLIDNLTAKYILCSKDKTEAECRKTVYTFVNKVLNYAHAQSADEIYRDISLKMIELINDDDDLKVINEIHQSTAALSASTEIKAFARDIVEWTWNTVNY